MKNDQIEEVMRELQAHNVAIGAGERAEDKLRSDAQHVLMARGGIDIETMSMMLTDAFFAAKAARSQVKELDAKLNELKGANKEASEERFANLKKWEAEGDKWKNQDDMYGFNFFHGMAAGANWCDISYGRVIRALDAVLATSGKIISTPEPQQK